MDTHFGGCRAVQRSKQWEGVLTWAEADGHNPWNTHFPVFRWLVAPCTALPACTALLRAEWSVWPSQMHLCLRVGRAEFYYPILGDPTIETQQSSYGVNGSHPWPLVPEYEQDTQIGAYVEAVGPLVDTKLWLHASNCKKKGYDLLHNRFRHQRHPPSPRVAQAWQALAYSLSCFNPWPQLV